MAAGRRAQLEAEIEAADGSSSRLAAVFAELEREIGREAASELWWAVFGASDATHT